MGNITIRNITFSYTDSYDTIFENVDIDINAQWKLGLIGRNGKGKTTLLKLIAGELKPSSGTISMPMETEKFPFEIEDENLSVRNVIKDCVGSFAKMELNLRELLLKNDQNASIEYAALLNRYNELGGYEIESSIEKELKKMKLEPSILNQKFVSLSGGEKTKIKILALFLKGEKFLLIDEPTNHLDLFGRATLANYLSKKKGYILVSHDQEFLDSCVDHILSINKTTIKLNKCGFSQWDENRINNEKSEMKKKENLLDEAEKLENASAAARGWSFSKEKGKKKAIDSGFEGRRSAKMMKRAKSMENRRDKRLEEVKTLLKDYEERKVLEIKQEKIPRKKYLGVYDLSYTIDNKTVLDSVNFQLDQGDRLWVKGVNGSGKTSLLKIISGETGNYTGSVKKYNGINISHSHQDIESCETTVEEYRMMCGSNRTVFITILDYFNMDIEYLDKKISMLSEGEKKKVEIAKTLSNTSEIYLWDEILNYMDIYFRIQIEEAIFKYNPTLIFVSHDESFGNKIATKILDLTKTTLS